MLASMHAHYRSMRERNSLVGLGLGLLAVVIVGFIGLGLLIRIPSLDFSLDSIVGLFPSSVSTMFSSSAPQPAKDKINILVTGEGGGVHDGPDLTDTIMLASLNFKTNTISLVSIPRDLYVQFPTGVKGGAGKINAIFATAE